jgi:RNase P/RNase MRP subunit p30
MRQYVDLHLRPKTSEQAWEMAKLASEFGYRQVAITFSDIEKQTNKGLQIAARIDLVIKKQNELLDALKKWRKNFDIVSVKCLTKEVSRQAAKDHRIDIIQFPEDPVLRKYNWFDIHEAELAEGTGCAYEVNISEILSTGPTRLSKVINQIKRDIANASKHDIPIVISSGANNLLAMREPKALTALASLLDIDEEYALDMISTIPAMLLERNRIRRGEEEP